MMKVVCLKHGTKYGAEWVLNLRRMVQRNLPIPHDFICVTEKPVEGVGCIPLDTDLEGWWAKMWLHKPGVLDGDILYLDLDVVVTDSLLPLVALLYKSPGPWLRDDFSYSCRNPKQGLGADFLKLLGGPGCVNSSVILWHGDVTKDVWEKFEPWMMKEMAGDQNALSHILRGHIQFIPDEMVCSLKYHVMRGLPVAPIVVYHGQPKVTDMAKEDPLRKIWEAA